jgi:hypothetical protein
MVWWWSKQLEYVENTCNTAVLKRNAKTGPQHCGTTDFHRCLDALNFFAKTGPEYPGTNKFFCYRPYYRLFIVNCFVPWNWKDESILRIKVWKVSCCFYKTLPRKKRIFWKIWTRAHLRERHIWHLIYQVANFGPGNVKMNSVYKYKMLWFCFYCHRLQKREGCFMWKCNIKCFSAEYR